MAQQGVDLYAMGQFLDNKTPRMTQRYAHLSPGYMTEAAGNLDSVMARVLPERPSLCLPLLPVESLKVRASLQKPANHCIDLVSQETTSWNTLFKELHLLDSFRRSFPRDSQGADE